MHFATEFWSSRAIVKMKELVEYLELWLGETHSTRWGPEKFGSQEGGGSQGSGQARLLAAQEGCNEGRMNVLPLYPLVRAVSIFSGIWCCIVLHTRGMRGTLPESPVLPP